jgi:hypothetical protein
LHHSSSSEYIGKESGLRLNNESLPQVLWRRIEPQAFNVVSLPLPLGAFVLTHINQSGRFSARVYGFNGNPDCMLGHLSGGMFFFVLSPPHSVFVFYKLTDSQDFNRNTYATNQWMPSLMQSPRSVVHKHSNRIYMWSMFYWYEDTIQFYYAFFFPENAFL